MKTDFDYLSKDLMGAVVFRPDFNDFETINESQAWCLFFTAGREDKVLGRETELGRFFTYLLIAIGVSGIVLAAYFNNFV